MNGDRLYVQPEGVRSYSQTHSTVVAALSELMGASAPEPVGIESTHGPIASAVSSALSQVLASRHGTLQATSTSAQTISELLQKAAQMYEQGDQKTAETLRAAAGAIHDANASGSPAGSSGAGAGEGGRAEHHDQAAADENAKAGRAPGHRQPEQPPHARSRPQSD
jgi:hypothetical protein